MNSIIIGYLQAVDAMSAKLRAKTIEGIVLQHGKSYPPPAVARPKGIKKGKNRECYRNAYLLAQINGWQYVEGFAISSNEIPIPLQHAWVVDHRGIVIETTWADAGLAYFGIPLEWSFMEQVIFETRCYGILDHRSETFRKRFSPSVAPLVE